MKQKHIIFIFSFLTIMSLLATFWVSKELLFPFITSKAFYFRILVELALPFYLYLILSNKNYRPNFKSPLTISVLAFLAIAWISAVFGVNVNKSIWGNFERMGGSFYLTHLALLYFYVLLLGQIGGNGIKRFLQALLVVAAIVTLNGISGVLGGPTLTPDPSLPDRASSTLGNPIFFASFLILPMFISLFFALQAEDKKAKAVYWILALLQLVGIVQSGTRGAVVGLVIGGFVAAVFFVILTSNKRIRNYGSVLLVIAVLVVAGLFAVNKHLPEGTTLRRVFNLKDTNTQSRFIQWKIALSGYKDYPVFGTGPEDYYLVGNKYYNPEAYKYDRSWFDKPHNYILEILLTTGALGLLAYLSMLFFSVGALWRSWKAGLTTLGESAFLFAGLLVYQIQNLFVFDTIPASLMFYSFLGLLGYLDFEANHPVTSGRQKLAEGLSSAYAKTVFAVSAVLCIYLIYAANIMPALAAKSVNYGFAYASVDPKKGGEFFDKVVDWPFNFDETESGGKYSDFAMGLVRSQLAQQDPEFVERHLKQALDFQKQAIAQGVGTDPVALQKLANLYLYSAVFHKAAIAPEAVEAIEKAISLAPGRVEARLALAQLRLFQGFPEEAAKITEEVVKMDPTNKLTQWQLALIYVDAGRVEEAAARAEKMLSEGYEFQNSGEASWLIAYYVQTSQLDKAISLGERALEFEAPSMDSAKNLLRAYVAAGENEKAQKLADNLIKFNPDLRPEVQAILGQ